MHVGRADLVLEDVPAPEPVGDQVVVKVAGAGVCHSDLYVLDGAFPVELEHLPVTMGHEIAGWIEGAGPNAKDVRLGEAVAVMVGWGCGTCRWCVRGHEQICPEGDEAGSTKDGGFAEFVLVPHRRHLVSLGSLDPVSAAPLGDAALSSYAAVKRVAPYLRGGSALVVIGVGGLGQFGVQFARLLTGATVVAVDSRLDRLGIAETLGAHYAVEAGAALAGALNTAGRSRGSRGRNRFRRHG